MPVGTFHINPQDYSVSECKAKVNCPFIEDIQLPRNFNHFATKEQALAQANAMQEHNEQLMICLRKITNGEYSYGANVIANINGFTEMLLKNCREAIAISHARKPKFNDFCGGMGDAVFEISSNREKQRTPENKMIATAGVALSILESAEESGNWNVYERSYKRTADMLADIFYTVINAKTKEELMPGLQNRLQHIPDLEVSVRESNPKYFEELRTSSNMKHLGYDY